MTSTDGMPPHSARSADGSPAWAWSAMLVTGVGWLVFCWTVLRVEPADLAWWAGAAVMLGAAGEVVRAFAGGRLWVMNAGLAVLFAVTGAVILADGGGSLTTPAALIGWYLLVRGAVDIVVATGSRASDASWVLMVIVGVAQAGLGFWSSSSFARTADVVVVLVGALALARALADLTSAFGLFSALPSAGRPGPETSMAQRPGSYAAGMADFEQSARAGRARHRAPGDEPVVADAPAMAMAGAGADRDPMMAPGGALGSTALLGTGFGSSLVLDHVARPAASVQGTQAQTVRISPGAADVAPVEITER
jgi:uncharacterized membrane protein HdeD (DUF308 family)